MIFNIIMCQLIKISQFHMRHCTHTNAAFSTGIGIEVSFAAQEKSRFHLV